MSSARPGGAAPKLRNGVIRRGNSWSYVIRVTDSAGVSKPRWVGGFPTEAAAKRARDEARIAAGRGEFVDRSTLTVGEYLDRWLLAHALEVKPRTRAGYAHLINTYVAPRIGRIRLQALRPADLSTLYRQLLESGGRGGKEQAAAVVMWTADDLGSFLATTQGHRLHGYFRLAAYTGARRGELMNLRWADVHLGDEHGQGAFVRLRGTVSVIGGVRVEGSTKGGRERTVSIDPGTAAVLTEHSQRQEAERAVAGALWGGGNHVFRRELGEPLFPDTPTALMAKLQRQHNTVAAQVGTPGLPVIRLHDLRHLHATLLLKAGVPVHVVAARLGHADPAITLRVYAHVLDDQASGAATTFEELIGGNPTDP